MNKPGVASRGFTLLEVLVAFVVMALSLGVLLHIFSLAMRTTSTAENHQRAILLAESKLAEVTAGKVLEPGRDSGRFDDRFHWSARIDRFELADEQDQIEFPVEPYRVQVAVSWNDSDTDLITLTTIRLVKDATVSLQQTSGARNTQ